MKLMEVVSVLITTIVLTVIGWILYSASLKSLPLDHPYLWKPHTIEVLVVIPLLAFYISILAHLLLLRPLFEWRAKR